jgi:ADP-ribose pyrophosphatase YjhB (NUDIX family)
MPRQRLHPIPAVIAVVKRSGRLLLVRRRHPPDAGLWGYPGGRIDFGESIQAATERELREETAVIGRADSVLTVLDAMHGPESRRPQTHYLLVVVLCRYVRGRASAGDDALEARWFALDEIGAMAGQLSRDVLVVARATLAKRVRAQRRAHAPAR